MSNHRYPLIPVIVVPYAVVKVEPHAGVLWVHCEVSKFSKSIFKDMDVQWRIFTEHLQQDLYVLYNPSVNTPSKKFIEHFGFRYLKTIEHENKTYQIWKKDKLWAA